MKRCNILCVMALAAISLGWLASSRPALGQSGVIQHDPQDVTGDWRGFYTSAKTLEQGVVVTVHVDAQTNRRFAGTLEIGEEAYEIRGTIAASSNVNIVGSSEQGTLVANLEMHDFGGGAALIEGKLKFHLADGTTDDGLTAQLRSYPFDPAKPPPDISGQWVGTYASAVAGKKFSGTYRSVMTLPKGSSTFTGYAILDEDTPDELVFPLVGTINGDGRFARMGQNAKAKICVEGRLIPPADDAAPPRIEAVYFLHYFAGGEDWGTLEQEVTPVPVVPDQPPEGEPIP